MNFSLRFKYDIPVNIVCRYVFIIYFFYSIYLCACVFPFRKSIRHFNYFFFGKSKEKKSKNNMLRGKIQFPVGIAKQIKQTYERESEREIKCSHRNERIINPQFTLFIFVWTIGGGLVLSAVSTPFRCESNRCVP